MVYPRHAARRHEPEERDDGHVTQAVVPERERSAGVRVPRGARGAHQAEHRDAAEDDGGVHGERREDEARDAGDVDGA